MSERKGASDERFGCSGGDDRGGGMVEWGWRGEHSMIFYWCRETGGRDGRKCTEDRGFEGGEDKME